MKTSIKVSVFCLLFLSGLLQSRFTHACGDPPPLPEITDAFWDDGVDNWFGRVGAINYFGQGVAIYPGLMFSTSCPSGCCGDSYGMDFRYFLDGTEQFCGGYNCGEYMFWLPNGAHTIRKDIRLFSGFAGDEVRPPLNYQEMTYSFSKTFNVDNDVPVITITHPENNVTVTTANAWVAVNVSDPLSKLEIVRLTLSAPSVTVSTACGFKKNLSGVEIDSTTPTESKGVYCSNRLYVASSPYCNEDIGVSAVFARIYNLTDYVDFSSGFDCHLEFSAIAMDRVGNRSRWGRT